MFFNTVVGRISEFLIFCLVVGVVCLLRYYSADENQNTPSSKMSFGKYVPVFLLRYKIRLAIALLLLLAGSAIAASVAALLVLFTVRKKTKYLNWRDLPRLEERKNDEWLAGLGQTHAVRAAAIEQMFSEKSATIHAAYFAEWSRWQGQEKTEKHAWIEVSRSLATMTNREREHLRVVELLNSAANGRERQYRLWRAALAYGEGKGHATGQWGGYSDTDGEKNFAQFAFESVDASVDQVLSALNHHLQAKKGAEALPAELKAAVDDSFDRLSQGGAGWLSPGKLAGTVFEPQGPHALHIGSFSDGTPLTYSGEGSMITIAPPGSGKTQCNVFPNLLSWRGPAVVLDISGDIYEKTSRWRAENVGPVFKFSPLEPEGSHSYNPLTFVRSEPDYIWEDAKLLAEVMIVPSTAADPFWENEARDVLTAAIAHVCYSNPPEQRPMHAVLDIMYGGEAWEAMLLGLRMAVDVRVMGQNANALAGMNEKTLSSVLQTARSSLSAWTGERIARVTRHSDWNPNDLRSETCPTIYIYIRPNEVESYLSLLRVFIGQHIRMLTGGAAPAFGAPPILFMLDELPRLRNMPPVDEALNIGRKYGLRLWMFAQSVGQLEVAYKNANGMIGSCAVRMYMNPSGADGLAEKLSEEIGNVDSFTDGQRKRQVEASELAGPAYRDQILVFGANTRPARVLKNFAWKDPQLSKRLGAVEAAPAK